jgi:MFS family permease
MMKMQGKPGVKLLNLIAIPLLTFCLLASDADVLQEITDLLKDPAFFNLSPTGANKLNANAASIASFATIPALLLSGVVFDVAGRRPTIIALLLMGALCTYLLPVSSPSKIFFILVRVGIQVSMVCLIGNTLVNDYVVAENRGKATAVQNLGTTLGNVFSVLVMYTITTRQGEYMKYSELGTLQVMWAVLMYFLVCEPEGVYNEKEARRANRHSFCGKVWSLSKLVIKACQADKALLIGTIAFCVAKNVTMI